LRFTLWYAQTADRNTSVSNIRSLSIHSTKIRSKLRKFLPRDGYADADTKTRLLSAYLDIALEHQEAIVRLIRLKLFGSAFSLARSVLDTMRRAGWINGCATKRQIEDAWDGKLNWLKIKVVADLERSWLIKAAGTERDAFFTSLKKIWPAMCDFPHSGAQQIALRFTDGELKPNYPESAIYNLIGMTNVTLLLLSAVVFARRGLIEEAKEAQRLCKHYVRRFHRTP
jgi:hypothetical protein